MISLQGVQKIYPNTNSITHALKDISLEVAHGEIFGILGGKGAGKTTLARCISSLEKPTAGTIVVDHCAVTSLKNKAFKILKHSISMIWSEPHLLNTRTIFDNVALPLELSGTSKYDIHCTVYSLLQMVGLAKQSTAYPHQITPAQRQKLSIVRAFAHKPKVLLCDEITASFDPKTTHAILQLLRDINERFKVTILLMSTAIENLKSICHKAAILQRGELIEQGSMAHLFANGRSEFARDLIKSLTRSELPIALRRRLRPHSFEYCNFILRISFMNVPTQETFIAQILQQYHLTLNIMQAYVETFHHENIGIMIAEVMGDQDNIYLAIDFFKNNGLNVEVLGYALRTQ